MTGGVVGVGTDIVSVERMAALMERHGEKGLLRLFTPAEVELCSAGPRPAERFAARFAAKEAVSKAIGTGMGGGVSFLGVEVLADESGRPVVRLRGRTAEAAEARGITEIHVSISHDGGYAVAFAVATGEVRR